MSRHVRLALLLISVVGVLSLLVQSTRGLRVFAASRVVAQTMTSSLEPLPKGCGGGLPPGEHEPACCMYGYVIIDDQPVADAKVTLSSSHGSTQYSTDYKLSPTRPTYRFDLSTLGVQAGDSITIRADYSSHSQTITYQVLGGGQQVDVVLPRTNTDDYIVDQVIDHPAPTGTLLNPSDVAVDGSGTIYVADKGNARIEVFNSNGAFLRQWGMRGDGPGKFMAPAGITTDPFGSVYVSDQYHIQKFTNTGDWIETIGDVGAAPGAFNLPAELATDGDGNLYVADMRNGRIQKFDRNGTYIATWNGANTPAGALGLPTGIAVGPDGLVYVADSSDTGQTDHDRIVVFTNTGVYQRSWGSYGTGNGQFKSGIQFRVAVDSRNTVYVTDTANDRVQQFTTNGVFVRSWGAVNDQGQPAPGDSNGQFNYPQGIAVDASGIVYVADQNNSRIQKLMGDRWTSWGTSSSPIGGQFGIGFAPLALASNGDIYVAEQTNNRIEVFSADGTLKRSWGTTGVGIGQFSAAFGIALDQQGHVFTTDAGANHVQKCGLDGSNCIIWGAPGSAPGQFNTPWGIAVTNDVVYVVDSNNNRVQKFTTQGALVTDWNVTTTFAQPQGIALDANGDVYVTDTGNNLVKKVRGSDGTLLATWGADPGGVRFATPEGITVDAGGNVYVTQNHQIQKFDSTGNLLALWGQYGAGPGQLSGPHTLAVRDGLVYVEDNGNRRIQMFRPMTYTQPTATIVAADPRTFQPGDRIKLQGRGGVSMPGRSIVGYGWTIDDSATPFATSPDATLDTGPLNAGTHTVRLRVQDNTGAFSDAQAITIASASQPTGATPWTFLLYLDGDNSGTAPYLDASTPLGVLYRLVNSVTNANVQVVALYDGPGQGDTVRYTIKPHATPIIEALGEKNMGDPQTLIDFVSTARQHAPSDHVYLAIADHANGIDGIAWDYTSTPIDHLTNSELRSALQTITQNGDYPIDVLHFDGCSMGLIENAYQMRGLAHYLVSSENLGWSAFAYDTYLQEVTNTTDATQLATTIADQYAHRVASYPYTIAALDLTKVNAVATAVQSLASELLRYSLASTDQRSHVEHVRQQAQTFDSDGNVIINDADTYIDLDHWASLVQAQIGDDAVQHAASTLLTIIPSFVIAEHHNSGSYSGHAVNLDNAHGVAIYYPTTPSATTYQTYARGDLTFPSDTGWSAFLAGGLDALSFNPMVPTETPIAPLPLTFRIYLPIVVR